MIRISNHESLQNCKNMTQNGFPFQTEKFYLPSKRENFPGTHLEFSWVSRLWEGYISFVEVNCEHLYFLFAKKKQSLLLAPDIQNQLKMRVQEQLGRRGICEENSWGFPRGGWMIRYRFKNSKVFKYSLEDSQGARWMIFRNEIDPRIPKSLN